MNKILLVDDDTTNRELMATVLAMEGYYVSTAVNGEQAIRRLHAHHPTLMLLDLVMPIMDGYEVLKEMTEHKNESWASVPVLILSAAAEVDQLAKTPPVIGILHKPFSGEKLVEVVREVFTRIVRQTP